MKVFQAPPLSQVVSNDAASFREAVTGRDRIARELPCAETGLPSGALLELANFLNVSLKKLPELAPRLRFVADSPSHVLETVQEAKGNWIERPRLLRLNAGGMEMNAALFDRDAVTDAPLLKMKDMLDTYQISRQFALLSEASAYEERQDAAQWKKVAAETETPFPIPEWDSLGIEDKGRFGVSRICWPSENIANPSVVQVEMQYVLRQITKECALDAAVAWNRSQAEERYTAFFKKDACRSKKDSEVRIQNYMDFRIRDGIREPVPADLRELMVRLDMAIPDVHRGLPFGRTNLLVGEGDVQSQGITERQAGEKLDLAQMNAKDALYILQERVCNALVQMQVALGEVLSGEKMDAIRCAAALFIGGGVCDYYAALFALRAAKICYEFGDKFEKVELVRLGFPVVRLAMEDPNAVERRLVHSSSVIQITTKREESFTILLEPWSDIGVPVLQEHISFLEKSGKLNAEVLYTHDCKSSPLLGGEVCQKMILEHMQPLSDLLWMIMQDPSVIEWIRRCRASVKEISPDHVYTLADPAETSHMDRSGTSLTMRFPNAPRRRLSLVSARTSPLVEWLMRVVDEAERSAT